MRYVRKHWLGPKNVCVSGAGLHWFPHCYSVELQAWHVRLYRMGVQCVLVSIQVQSLALDATQSPVVNGNRTNNRLLPQHSGSSLQRTTLALRAVAEIT